MISDVCRRKPHARSPPRLKTNTMQVKKEIRQIAREMLRASFTDGQFDRGRITSVVDSILAKKPRNYLKILEYFKRLLRLEAEKRHARIETTTALEPQIVSQISLNLARSYGTDLTAAFSDWPLTSRKPKWARFCSVTPPRYPKATRLKRPAACSPFR